MISILPSESLTDASLFNRSGTSPLLGTNCNLGAFEKLRKEASRFAVSVRSSVSQSARTHGKTWLSLDGFL
jgi:hypothetical protein